MANPQPTDAHLRMAHSIYEAIMMRDFSKHQRKILDLILRLSWGCGKKEAIIPRQRDFTVVGIHEVDIKKDLSWLEASLIIGRDSNTYWFNKNFDQWQVSRVKPYDPEKLSELLSINLNGHQDLSKTLSPDELPINTETSLIMGQSIERAKSIARGELPDVPVHRRELFKRELLARGVKLTT